MYSKKVIVGAIAAAALVPILALAQTSDTQAQIQSLVTQIQTLQKQLKALISSAGTYRPIGTEGLQGIVSGTISSVSTSSIMVQNRDASKSVVVNFTASTTIEVFASSTPEWRAGTTADLVVGKGVGVQGTPNLDGSVQAIRIKVGILASAENKIMNAPPGQVGKAMCISLKRNLTPGSRGEDVRGLQEMLREDPELGFSSATTGVFGPLTTKAMIMFQKKHGIPPVHNGAVGPLTRGMIERNCGKGLGNPMPLQSGQSTPFPPPPTAAATGTACNGVNASCNGSSI